MTDYEPGTTLTFASGMIGSVTLARTLTLVSPQGWVAGAKLDRAGRLIRPLPTLEEYLKTNTVIKAEMLPPSFFR